MRKQLCSRSKLAEMERHKEQWSGCVGCALHASASQKVFYRGQVPCDVLFVGNAPSPADNDTGLPFVGDEQAKIFDYVVSKGLDLGPHLFTKKVVTFAVTNAVLCKPPLREDVTYESLRDLEKEEIRACGSRLSQFVSMAEPKLIVNIGKEAEKATLALFMETDTYYRSLTIVHPNYILRKEDKELEKQRVILQLKQAIQNVLRNS